MSSPSASSRDFTMLGVTSAVIAARLPVLVVGAAAVLVRAELGFDVAGVGLAVSSFSGAAALSSVMGGRLSERLGARASLRLASGVAGCAALLIGTSTTALGPLVLLLAVSGVANGIAQPAANLALAQSRRRGVALRFGIKQSAAPGASLIAGASVPLVGLTVGWRWTFVFAAALCFAVALLMPQLGRDAAQSRRAESARGDVSLLWMVALATAGGVASAAASVVSPYLVESSVGAGMSVEFAAWVLVLGSIGSICTRLSVGWLADRWPGRALHMVATMLALATIGYGLLSASASSFMAVVGALVALGIGWGWPGLFQYAIVRLNPRAPGAASGIVQTGIASGATIGPLLFGLVVREVSFALGWALVGVASVIAALLVLVLGYLLSLR